MKLIHIFFTVLAQSKKIQPNELTEDHVLTFFRCQKNSNETLPVTIGFGIDSDLEVVHADWDAHTLINEFKNWRLKNNYVS